MRWSRAGRSRSSAPAVVTVTGDGERLRQVIDNLLANVRAHTPADAAAIVRVRREGDARAARGRRTPAPGLAAEQAAHVFERFYRGDPSRSRDHGGAGLGLAIVAAIVEAHGGTVAVESSPARARRSACPADRRPATRTRSGIGAARGAREAQPKNASASA